LRYLDQRSLVRAWLQIGQAANDWHPDVTLAYSCDELRAAPPALRTLTAPCLYYGDYSGDYGGDYGGDYSGVELSRVGSGPAARAGSTAAARLLYGPLWASQRRDDRAAIAAASALATSSDHTARAIAATYQRSATVIAPGVAGAFAPDHSRGAQVNGFDRGWGCVLSVGSLMPSKGHDLAIETMAAARLALPLIVVAPRDDLAERSRLRALAAHERVSLDIRIGISDAELAHLYRSALATLYLARAKSPGLVSLESQACGTPVVVAAEGGLGDTVRPNVTGFAVPRHPGKAAEALRVIGEPGRRIAMGRAAAAVPVTRDGDSGRMVLAALADVVDRTRSRRPSVPA
jgi:glycosyltransferase involved in cell wall biosynthesis